MAEDVLPSIVSGKKGECTQRYHLEFKTSSYLILKSKKLHTVMAYHSPLNLELSPEWGCDDCLRIRGEDFGKWQRYPQRF